MNRRLALAFGSFAAAILANVVIGWPTATPAWAFWIPLALILGGVLLRVRRNRRSRGGSRAEARKQTSDEELERIGEAISAPIGHLVDDALGSYADVRRGRPSDVDWRGGWYWFFQRQHRSKAMDDIVERRRDRLKEAFLGKLTKGRRWRPRRQ